MSNFYLGRRSLGQLVGVYPEIGFVMQEAIKITPIDFTIFDGIRNKSEQQALVDAGASWTMDSYHMYGLAIDQVPIINGKKRFELEPAQTVNKTIKEVLKAHGIVLYNGWDMWGKDAFHWQKNGFKTSYDVRKLKHDLRCK